MGLFKNISGGVVPFLNCFAKKMDAIFLRYNIRKMDVKKELVL